MIRITDAAQKHFSKLLSNQKKGTQIRIFIINPGTSNAEYGVSYCPPDAIDPTDTKLKVNNIFIYIDKISFFYLQDIQIDFITNKLGSQLTIKVLDTKVCKLNTDDPLIERLEQFLILQINPYLASHNGQVKLINITSDMFAVIQFSGGCNGCSMANYTLKEWIEKEVLKFFPELNGVRDFTDHQHGDHSYY